MFMTIKYKDFRVLNRIYGTAPPQLTVDFDSSLVELPHHALEKFLRGDTGVIHGPGRQIP